MKWLTIGFVVFIVAVVILADTGNGEWMFRLIGMVPGGDKTGHFVLVGTLALLVNLSLKARRVEIGRWKVLLGSAVIAAVFTVEEFSQLLFETRGFSLLDLSANYIGILVFGWVAARWVERQQAPAAILQANDRAD
ncbi:MAG TPA: hypothetical protein VHP83_07850 [Aggregatilineaceae bacterium]|nr:hypothetical protein [Aggregatilineaceae bacterium]